MVKVGGTLVYAMKFANDQAMVANSDAGLQRIMDSLCSRLQRSMNETKVMRISRTKGRLLTVTINGSKLEQFKQFFYLGSKINGGLQMPHGNRK